jgi:hypothetical protein
MGNFDKWNKARGGIHSVPRATEEAKDYYLSVLRSAYNAGVDLATPEMAAIWPYDNWDAYYGLAEICETKGPVGGIIWLENHERTKPIEDFIRHNLTEWVEERLTEMEGEGGVWLMPVFDDEEYVSWNFFFMLGTEEAVVDALSKMEVASI